MRITAELSLYPLRDEFVSGIKAFIGELRAAPGVEVQSNQMSTQVRGDFEAVNAAIQRAMRGHFEQGRPASLVVKYLNADLPIGQAPDV